MSIRRAYPPRARRLAVGIVGLALAAFGATAISLPANAATLSSASFAVSSNVAGATGVTYTWTFTPATAVANLASTNMTFTVPTGTTWTAAAPTALYGVSGATTGTPTFASNTVTLPFTAGSLTAGRPVSVTFANFTNGSAVASFASAITTSVDSGNATAVSIAANSTTVTVLVPQSLTLTNSTTAVSLLPLPGASAITTAAVTLGVSTNAAGGYTLKAVLANPLTAGTPTIASLTAGSTTDLTASTGFGASATATGATLSAPWASTTSSLYTGYAATAGGSGATVATNAGPTAGDSITITNGVRVPGTQASGTYTGTVTYVVTPSW